MEHTTLGPTGTSVSRFALGTMTFGRESSEEESRAQLDLFTEHGGTLVDTANAYGAGASEEIIGRWFADRPTATREHVVLATKARFPTGPGPNDLGLSRKHLTAALDASLRRLRTHWVDLFQVHAFDPHTPLEETLGFLDDAVTAGKIHYVGLSNYTGWQIQRAVDIARFTGLTAPVSIQPQYNLLAREVEWEILPAARANGLGILPWSPLGGGWLTGKYSRDRMTGSGTRVGENPGRGVEAFDRRGVREQTWAVIETLRKVADARAEPMSRVALAWVLARPGVTSVILGARTGDHLLDNLRAGELRLDGDELDLLTAVSTPDTGDYPYGPVGEEQRTRRLAGGR